MLSDFQKDYHMFRIINLYHAHLMCGVLTLDGPVKMDHFIKLKNYIRLFNIDIKEIIVK